MVCPWNSPGKNTGVDCIPFSTGSSWHGDRTQVSCIAGEFFTIWATVSKSHLINSVHGKSYRKPDTGYSQCWWAAATYYVKDPQHKPLRFLRLYFPVKAGSHFSCRISTSYKSDWPPTMGCQSAIRVTGMCSTGTRIKIMGWRVQFYKLFAILAFLDWPWDVHCFTPLLLGITRSRVVRLSVFSTDRPGTEQATKQSCCVVLELAYNFEFGQTLIWALLERLTNTNSGIWFNAWQAQLPPL